MTGISASVAFFMVIIFFIQKYAQDTPASTSGGRNARAYLSQQYFVRFSANP